MQARFLIIAALTWAALFLCPKTSFSQDFVTNAEVSTSDETLTLAPIELKTTQYDSTSSVLDAPKAAGLTRSQTIDVQAFPALTSLDQVIARHSGIQTTNGGSRLAQQGISMRGSASQDLLLSYGGVILNGLSQSSADLAILPTGLISSLELLPNAGSQSLGLGSLGGAVLIEPTFLTPKLQTSLIWGSHGDYGLLVGHGQTLEATRYELTAFGDKSDGNFSYIDDEDTVLRRSHNAAHRLGGQAQVEQQFSAFHLKIFAFVAHLEREVAGVSEFPNAYRLAKQESLLSLSKVTLDFTPKHIADHGYLDSVLALSHRFARNTYSNPKTFMGGRPYISESFEHRASLHLDTRLFLDHWSESALGIYYDIESVSSSELSPTRDSTAQVLRHILALSLSEQSRFFADRLQVYAGLRLDWPIEQRPLFSGRLSIYGRPLEWLSLHASLAYAARLPSFDEQYLQNEFVRGNAKLLPQHSLLSDLAIHFELATYFSLECVGFFNLHWSLIRFIPISAHLHEAQNLPLSAAGGLELRLVSTPLEGLELSLSYHFTEAFVLEGHLPIPQIARHRLSSRLAYQNDMILVALTLGYSGKLARSFSFQYRPHDGVELGLNVALSIFEHLRLTLDISNLSNDRRREDIVQHPLGGVHAMLGLSYEL